MAFLEIKNVSIRGISACVPENKDVISDIYKWEGQEAFSESTGIKERRRVLSGITASDLCEKAANRLLEEMGWERETVDALVFVSQTPDYRLPATSCLLQSRLGLSRECYTLDISLGCSGWVYGLSVISALMQTGTIKRGLLLAGDTLTQICAQEDKSTYPLFGDAGTVTALEYDSSSAGFKFVFNTDGDGYETIICEDGGSRHPISESSLKEIEVEKDIIRKNVDLALDGMDVFSFGITKAPKSVKQLLSHFDIDKEAVDVYSFHQANLKMNEMIRRKLGIGDEKVPYCMCEFGNTSCASIPLVLVTKERERLESQSVSHVSCGFGVGLSWGSVWYRTDRIKVPKLLEI